MLTTALIAKLVAGGISLVAGWFGWRKVSVVVDDKARRELIALVELAAERAWHAVEQSRGKNAAPVTTPGERARLLSSAVALAVSMVPAGVAQRLGLSDEALRVTLSAAIEMCCYRMRAAR